MFFSVFLSRQAFVDFAKHNWSNTLDMINANGAMCQLYLTMIYPRQQLNLRAVIFFVVKINRVHVKAKNNNVKKN